MAYALVGSKGVVQTGIGPQTPPWGAGSSQTVGNLLILSIANSSNVQITPPTGWSLGIDEFSIAGNGSAIFYKVATGGDAAPSVGNGQVGIQLSEWSGNNQVAPLDKTASSAATTGSPIVTTAASADVAAGQLIVAVGMCQYSTAATKTITHTLNNGATADDFDNDATSTFYHWDHTTGVTTTNASADSDSLALTTTKISQISVCMCSFLLAPPLTTAVIPHRMPLGV